MRIPGPIIAGCCIGTAIAFLTMPERETKTVNRKATSEGQFILVANDWTTTDVSFEKYATVDPGDKIYARWRKP